MMLRPAADDTSPLSISSNDLRISRVEHYENYYRVLEGDVRVEIIRVLHGARDVGAAIF